VSCVVQLTLHWTYSPGLPMESGIAASGSAAGHSAHRSKLYLPFAGSCLQASLVNFDLPGLDQFAHVFHGLSLAMKAGAAPLDEIGGFLCRPQLAFSCGCLKWLAHALSNCGFGHGCALCKSCLPFQGGFFWNLNTHFFLRVLWRSVFVVYPSVSELVFVEQTIYPSAK